MADKSICNPIEEIRSWRMRGHVQYQPQRRLCLRQGGNQWPVDVLVMLDKVGKLLDLGLQRRDPRVAGVEQAEEEFAISLKAVVIFRRMHKINRAADILQMLGVLLSGGGRGVSGHVTQ